MGVTKIEWTDYTFNPWRGCEHKQLPDGSTHPGCEHCYAEAMAPRNPRLLGTWGAMGRRVMAPDDYWERPVRWNDLSKADGVRRKVFCASLADVFEDWNIQVGGDPFVMLAVEDIHGNRLCEKGGKIRPQWPDEAGWRPVNLCDLRDRLFDLIDRTPFLDWLLLTKRPENIQRMWPDPDDGYRPNVWLGTSVSDQATAELMIPELLRCRKLAPVLFLSCEPLTGKIDLERLQMRGAKEGLCYNALRSDDSRYFESDAHLDWIIAGGESGPRARPVPEGWVKDLRRQCYDASVPFFFKQWGEWLPISQAPLSVLQHPKPFAQTGVLTDGTWGAAVTPELCRERETLPMLYYKTGKSLAGRQLDDFHYSEFPEPIAF